jgi:ribosomal protein S18 acetylase RimI-like enzyme
MSFYKICINKLRNSNLGNFVDALYTNFYHLSKFPELKHSKPEILNLLMSDNVQVYFYIVNGKIVSYLIGEIMNLNDGRKVFYITYILTAKNFRGNKYATRMMEQVEKIVNENNLDAIVLMCDTENSYVYNFYLAKGFMPDLLLRKYTRFEVLSK